jgi:hypothetical protein
MKQSRDSAAITPSKPLLVAVGMFFVRSQF